MKQICITTKQACDGNDTQKVFVTPKNQYWSFMMSVGIEERDQSVQSPQLLQPGPGIFILSAQVAKGIN